MARLTLILNQDERDALLHLAQRDRRDLRDQAVWLLRQRMQEVGALAPDPGAVTVMPVILAQGAAHATQAA